MKIILKNKNNKEDQIEKFQTDPKKLEMIKNKKINNKFLKEIKKI